MVQWKFEKLTREELYELVWSEPMVKAAARYGMSDVNLKKICRKHGIPVPGRGYWRRREVGRNAPRVPLPKSGDTRPIQIRVREKPQEDVT